MPSYSNYNNSKENLKEKFEKLTDKITLKETLEKDIESLLKKAIEERNYLNKITRKYTNGEVQVDVTQTPENKDYRNYRKLINTLDQMLSAYKRVTNYKYQEEFYSLIITNLNSEMDCVHSTMEKTLALNYVEQYRCLADAYTTLIEVLDKIQELKPNKKFDKNTLNKEVQRYLEEVVKTLSEN